VRSDLEKLPAVKDITTDFKTNIATFKLPKDSKVELKAKLDEFAKTNKHMKDWTFMDDGKGGTDGNGGKKEDKKA
jgi:hypothetical protein